MIMYPHLKVKGELKNNGIWMMKSDSFFTI